MAQETALDGARPTSTVCLERGGSSQRNLRHVVWDQAQNMWRRIAMLASSPSESSTLSIDEPP